MDAVYCQKHHNTVGVATCKLCVIDELKQQRDELLRAAENLIKVKGRHHTELAYKQLEAAIAKVKP